MVSFTTKLAFAALSVASAIAQVSNNAPLVGEGLFQSIPSTAQAPGTFSNGDPLFVGLPEEVDTPQPDMYGPRSIDLPFGRLFNGKLNFFPTVNDPTTNTATWGSEYDNANQSACGIPANAFFISQVAIHPYFLKFAGLDRYCMQDVCISFWNEDGTSDMMLKVTDVCTPDSEDGVPCLDPGDIKTDRSKIRILDGLPEVPQGDTYGSNVWWFFVKCWADGIAQPAYQTPNNWFTQPPLPNKLEWSQTAEYTQFMRNQESYPPKGWEGYPNGSYNTTRVIPTINDWDPEDVQPWTPLAGGWSSSGRGLGYTEGDGGAPVPAPAPQPSSTEPVVPTVSTSPEETSVAPSPELPTQSSIAPPPAPPSEPASSSEPSSPEETSAALPPPVQTSEPYVPPSVPSEPTTSVAPPPTAPTSEPYVPPSVPSEPTTSVATPQPAPTLDSGSCSAVPPVAPPTAEVASLYGQCGGIGWRGPTSCAEGSTCKVQNGNKYYSQCL